jgi:predicted nucleotidyltransferase component of viral defense system
LAGGTALALQIGHRVSVDFDLFSEQILPENLLNEIESVFSNLSVKTILNTDKQLTVTVNSTQVTFLTYPFPLIVPLVQNDFLPLLSIREIAATKAYSLGRRATFKDYVDLYFIVKEGHSDIKGIIELSEKKYQGAFNRKLFLEQLVYLRDITTIELEFLRETVDKEKIEKFFKTEIKNSDLL